MKLHLLRLEKRKITILNNVSSVLTPGRTTLLLGPPGGGKVRSTSELAAVFRENRASPKACSIPFKGHNKALPCLSYGSICLCTRALARF